jgi:hypothetical protein
MLIKREEKTKERKKKRKHKNTQKATKREWGARALNLGRGSIKVVASRE